MSMEADVRHDLEELNRSFQDHERSDERMFGEVNKEINGLKKEMAEMKGTFIGFQASLSTDISWLKTIVLGTLSASIASVVGMVFQFLKLK